MVIITERLVILIMLMLNRMSEKMTHNIGCIINIYNRDQNCIDIQKMLT